MLKKLNMIVTKVVEEDVADKVDIYYIREQFSQIDSVAIIFLCTKDEREEDDWVDEEV